MYVVFSCVCVCARAHMHARVRALSYSVMPDSLRPHGLYLARLLCPWNSTGKKTRVVCHALFQGIFRVRPWVSLITGSVFYH